jgi:DNA mismatch repair protein MutL
VAVRGLFRDFPARLKFLKSPQTEATRVQAAVSLYVMADPGVQLRLISDGRELFTSPGSGDLREAVSVVHGAEVARRLLAVAAESADAEIKVEGLISPPDLSRANRSYVSIFVNGRPVAARSLLYAVGEAYYGLLPDGRHPIAIVKPQVPCEDVDVNVHPAKAEVRFRREDAVFRAVQQAVRETLLAQAAVPTIAVGYPPPVPPSGPGVARRVAPLLPRPGRGDMQRPAPAPQQPPPSPTPLQALPALRVLGQVQATYIVAEGPDGLYLIDQHAAHERVLYERLRDAAARRSPEVQGLLEPVTAELSPQQAEAVRSHGEALAAYGWVLEEFGPQSFLLRGVPSVLKGKAPSQALIDLLDAIAADEGGETWEERLAATTACHGAVRAGASLTVAEMQEMVRLLERAREPHACPHARPTMLHLSASHLERQFGRR